MTERRRRPSPLPVVATAIATFLAVLSLLVAQMHAGRDPVLGGGASVASLTAKQHGARVVTRTSGGGPAAQPATTASASSKPVTTRTSGATGEVEDD
jgi:hypothetical protein